MQLQLRSGFVAEVVPPKLRSLLAGMTLAEAALATPGLSAEALTDEDAFALSWWAAEHLVDDPEAGPFTEVCAAFCCRPSAELHVADPLLAFRLDNALLRALAGSGEARQPDSEHDKHRVIFTSGGPE